MRHLNVQVNRNDWKQHFDNAYLWFVRTGKQIILCTVVPIKRGNLTIKRRRGLGETIVVDNRYRRVNNQYYNIK